MKPQYVFTGKVLDGAKRGRDLGYPTANVALKEQIPEGIYASEVILDEQALKAATFIGAAKTFGEEEYKAETYILDFDQNIYGKEITIQLYKKLRGNIAYTTKEALIEQMKKDVAKTREFFTSS